MITTFLTGFGQTFSAVMQILIIAAAAAILIRKKVLNTEQINALSAIVVRILLPCLMFSSITKTFHPDNSWGWLLIPTAAVLMLAAGLTAAAIVFARQLPEKKNLLAPAAFQNAAYLILPLGKVLYPEQFDSFATYCFLFLLGISPAMWTIGKYLVSSTDNNRPKLSQLITPPFVASLTAIVLALTNLRVFIPEIIISPIALLGSATVPIATFVLGAVLANVSLDIKSNLTDIVRVVSVKLLIIPVLTITALWLLNVHQKDALLANFFVLQAAAAPATALIIQVRHYGGKEKQLTQSVLACYLLCIISIPFWIAVWQMITA